jgi:long-chain acyl-CoA synthetase
MRSYEPGRRPWVEHYEPGVPADLLDSDQPFQAALDEASASFPGHGALLHLGRVIRYAELDMLADKVAAALLADGFRPGEVVQCSLPFSTAFVATAFGTLRAGGAFLPLEPGAHPAGPELAAIGPAVVVRLQTDAGPQGGQPGTRRTVTVPALEGAPAWLRWIARVTGTTGMTRVAGVTQRDGGRSRARSGETTETTWSDWIRPAGGHVELPSTRQDDVALITLHDGIATRFTHAQLTAGAAMWRAWLTDVVPGAESWVVTLPPSTPQGFVAMLGTAFDVQARVIWCRGDDRRALREALQTRPGLVVASAETTSEWLASDPNSAGVRGWISVAPPTAASAEPAATCEAYSFPWVAGLIACNPINGRRAAGSRGLPLPGAAIRVVDAGGRPLEPGNEGQVQVQGPNVAGSREWRNTGRRGRLDDAGFVYDSGGQADSPPATGGVGASMALQPGGARSANLA